MLAWLEANSRTLLIAGAVTGGAVVLFAVAAAVFFTWIPADFFRTPRRPPPKGHPALRIIRNVVGGVIIAVGLVLFLLPGPGTLVILVGLILTDFPGKHRMLRWILSRRMVFSAVNALRRRVAKSPLIIDPKPAPAPRSPARPA